AAQRQPASQGGGEGGAGRCHRGSSGGPAKTVTAGGQAPKPLQGLDLQALSFHETAGCRNPSDGRACPCLQRYIDFYPMTDDSLRCQRALTASLQPGAEDGLASTGRRVRAE